MQRESAFGWVLVVLRFRHPINLAHSELKNVLLFCKLYGVLYAMRSSTRYRTVSNHLHRPDALEVTDFVVKTRDITLNTSAAFSLKLLASAKGKTKSQDSKLP